MRQLTGSTPVSQGQHQHWKSTKEHLWIVTAVSLSRQGQELLLPQLKPVRQHHQCYLKGNQTLHGTLSFFWLKQAALRPFCSSLAPGAAEDAHLNSVCSSPSSEGPETSTCLYQKRTKEETLLEAVNEWEEQPDKLQIDAICGSSASG